MMALLICALGLTFFPGQPGWYELDTRGIEWTVYETVTEQVAYQPTCRCTKWGPTGCQEVQCG